MPSLRLRHEEMTLLLRNPLPLTQWHGSVGGTGSTSKAGRQQVLTGGQQIADADGGLRAPGADAAAAAVADR